MGSTQTHNIHVVASLEGMDVVSGAMNNFASTSSTVVKSQDALSTAMGKTSGAAIKTGQEFTKVEATETKTVKSTGSLGQAFKASALQITAFVSGLISTVMQVNSVLAAENKLDKQRELLNKKTIALEQAELKYNQGLANGTLTGEKARLAGEKLDSMRNLLAIDTEKLELKEQAHTASLTQLALTAIPTVISGASSVAQIYSTLQGVFDTAKGSTDASAESMDALGTAADTATTTGLIPTAKQILTMIPGVDKLAKALGIGKTGLTGAVANVGVEVQKHNKLSTQFVDAFKNMGSAVVNFASNIKTSMGSATGIIDKMKAGFSSFFTQLGAGFTGIGGHLKTAGAAFVSFGKTIGNVFMSNPILFIIGAITTALVGLIFNVGGFRDRMNELGVSIGKAVPFLKPLLDGLGFIGQKLGELGDYLMGTQSEMDKTAQSSKMLALAYDPQIVALQKLLDLGKNYNNLQALTNIFNEVRAAVDNLSTATVKGSTVFIETSNKALEVWTTNTSKFKNLTADQQKTINEVTQILTAYKEGHIELEPAQAAVNSRIAQLNQSLGESVTQTAKAVVQTQKAELANDGLSTSAANVVNALHSTGEEAEAVAQSLTEQEQAMVKLVAKYGLIIPAEENLTQVQKTALSQMMAFLPVFEKYGQLIVKNTDGTINWDASIKNITASHESMGDVSGKIWNKIGQYLTMGVEGYKQASTYVEIWGLQSKEYGQIAADALKSHTDEIAKNQKALSDQIDTIANGATIQEQSEAKVQKAIQTSSQKIQEKATKLKIWDDIQNLSVQNQENAIKITENQNKVENKSILTLQELAVARGLDISKIGESSASLLEHIKNSTLEANTLDDVNSRLAVLTDTRQKEAKQADLETQVQTALLAELGKVPPVLGMTAKGLENVTKLYQDTANAQGIAADTVGTWWAELEKSQAVEKATIKILQDFATEHGVTIPEAIKRKGIPAMKEYIAQATGMADATEETAQRIAAAFDEISKKGQEGLSNIIDENLLKGKFDKVIKSIEETGRSLDQLSVQQVIITPLLETTDFEDKIDSLSEIMGQEINETDLKAKDGGDQVMSSFTSGLLDKLGSEAQPIINTIDSIWTQVKTENPGKTGAELLKIFMDSMNKPSEMERLAQGLAASGAKGFESGGHLFATAGQKAMFELLKSYDPAKAEAYAAGHEIGAQTGKGLDSAKSLVQNATLVSVVNPITGEIQKVPANAATGLAPIEGVFSAAFIKASIASTGVLNALFADIYKSMGFLVTNTTTQLAQIESAWLDHATALGTPIENIKVQLLTLQETYSNLSLNIATYATSMTDNIGAWLLTTSQGFQNYEIIIVSVQDTFSQLSTNIDTYTVSITKNILEGWLLPTTKAYDIYIKKIQEVQQTFSILSTSVATYMKSMTTNIGDFAQKSGESFKKSGDAAFAAQGVMSKMSTSVATYMSSMTTHVNSFADACVKAFAKVGKAADDATAKVKALQSAINALKDKTVTITTRYVTQGKPGGRFGASLIGYARGGDSWIQDKPGKVGGMNVGEFSKPELITVTPLSNPYDVQDKSINLPTTKGNIPSIGTTALGQNDMSARPVQVTGDLYVTVTTQSGETLAKEVKPFLLKGFSGIT